MSVNLSIVTIWENETCLLIIRDSTVQRRLAMSTTQVCIWMAFSKHGHDLGKRNVPFDHSGQYRSEEIGDEYHPGLYLDSIHTLTVEKVQGKVLFELFIKGFDCPSTFVSFSKFLNREFKIIGQ